MFPCVGDCCVRHRDGALQGVADEVGDGVLAAFESAGGVALPPRFKDLGDFRFADLGGRDVREVARERGGCCFDCRAAAFRPRLDEVTGLLDARAFFALATFFWIFSK